MMFHVKPGGDIAPPDPLSSTSILHAVEDLGIGVTDVQAAELALHARMVLQANREFNLTRISSPADVLTLHVLDSALALEDIRRAPEGPVADLGSGAGYPGVVIAVLSTKHVLLVESVKKKARFLADVASEMGADIEVYADRAEQLACERGASFACVVARALAPLPSLVELAAPLLFIGGRLIAMKAQPDDSELEAGRATASLCGMRETAVRSLILRGTHTRTLVVYERLGRPGLALPRRTGLAQRCPLA